MPNGGREQNIERGAGWFRGEDKDFEALIRQSDDITPQQMNGWSLEWYVFDREGGRLLITRTSAGGHITISNGDGTNDKASWSCPAAETVPLRGAENYWHELWRVDTNERACLLYGTAYLRRGRY